HDRWMLKARGDQCFAHEPSAHASVGREQLLERHGPVEQLIERAHHATDPAASDLPGDAISRALGEVLSVPNHRGVRWQVEHGGGCARRGNVELRIWCGRGSKRRRVDWLHSPSELSTRTTTGEMTG